MKVRKIVLTVVVFILIACGNNIEKDSTKILVVQNDLITRYKKEVSEMENNPFSNILSGTNWKQNTWDDIYVNSKMDSLKSVFEIEYGEDEYNKLSLKLSDNFELKMN